MTVCKQCIEVDELEMYFSHLKPLKKHTQNLFQMHVFYRHVKGLKGSSDSDIQILIYAHESIELVLNQTISTTITSTT